MRVPGWYRPYPIRLRVVVVVSAARAIEAAYQRIFGKPPPNTKGSHDQMPLPLNFDLDLTTSAYILEI